MFSSFDLEGREAICLWAQGEKAKKSLNGFLVKTCPFSILGEKAESSDAFSSGGGSLLAACCSGSLALVGSHPLTRRRVAVWRGDRLEIGLDFDQEVTGLRLGENFLVVTTVDRVTVFDRHRLDEKGGLVKRYRTAASYRTGINQDGLVAVNRKGDYRLVLAFPTSPQPESGGEEVGKVTVVCPGATLGPRRREPPAAPEEDKCLTVNAHDSALAQLALNDDGTILATASEKGTVIRIFSAVNGSFLQEFKRGSAPARIFSLSFSPKVELKKTAKSAAVSEGEAVASQDKSILVQPVALHSFLCATSSTGTAHIFSVDETQREGREGERVPGGWRLLNYWGAASSCARFQLPPGPSVSAFHCHQGNLNLNVISWESQTGDRGTARGSQTGDKEAARGSQTGDKEAARGSQTGELEAVRSTQAVSPGKDDGKNTPAVYYRYLFDPVAQTAVLGEVQILS